VKMRGTIPVPVGAFASRFDTRVVHHAKQNTCGGSVIVLQAPSLCAHEMRIHPAAGVFFRHPHLSPSVTLSRKEAAPFEYIM
jgi:hypothetical protein